MMISTGKCRNARPAKAASFWPSDALFQSLLERIEGPETACQRQVDRNEDDGHHGKRRGQWNVTGCTLLLIHHHADEIAGRADDARDDVVAECERERKYRARCEP